MTTLKNIADSLGVSIRAVSYAVNGTGRLAPDTRKKILEKVLETGYVPNAAARSLVTSKSKLIGVLVPILSCSFYGRILAGIESVARKNGYTLLLMNPVEHNEDDCSTVCLQLLQRKVDGIILNPFPGIAREADLLLKLEVPIVQIKNFFPELGNHSLKVSNFESAKKAAIALYQSGCRNIGMIAHNQNSNEIYERYSGFIAGLKELMPEYVPPVYESSVDIQGVHQVAKKMLSEHPGLDAVFGASDFAAIGTAKAALELGLKIPEDISIIGFDNLNIAAEQLIYPFSTIDQPKEEMGIYAMEMMIDLINKKSVESKTFEAPLILRETTKNNHLITIR